MGYVKWSSAALAILLVMGCSAPEPPPPDKTVFDPMTRQMDKARDVQKTVDENAERTRRQIDNQEGGESRPDSR